ncbi:hypothetical protein GJAV_G00108360 [Gymnothorax javanicus]|nr:hypothetical protein GJAV_G00108360 [Gymnothorax javanicus]
MDLAAIIKRTDSDGALRASVRPMRPRDSVSTLGSSVGEPEDERPSVEEEEEEEDTHEQLPPSDSEEAGPGTGGGGAGKEAEGESDKEDVLMEGDQVADFASSMLEAISCWHYRARALLSSRVPPDAEGNDIIEENGVDRESGQSSGQEESCDTTKGRPLLEQESTEKQPESTEELEPSTMVGVAASTTSGQEDCEPQEVHNGDEDERMEVSPVLQQADAKALSGEESSETEDEDVEEATAPSILPSSVLDQASIIAKHFSTRRGSQIDEVRSLGCPSPRLSSRRGSTFSLGAEIQDRPPRSTVTCLDDPPALLSSDLALCPQVPDNLSEPEKSEACVRRDCTLSRQDQLLIGKIKSYYEHAEHHGASFSIKRRESLSYIPTGLVKSSITRLNSIPKDDAAVTKKGDTPDFASSATLDLTSDPCGDPTSFTGPDLPVQDKVQGLVDANGHEEEFRPSSEMIRVWQEMERELGGPRNSRLGSRGVKTSPQFPRKVQTTIEKPEQSQPLPTSGETKKRSTEVRVEPFKDLKSQTVGTAPEDFRAKRAPAPRVIHLRREAAEDLLREDTEQGRKKVFQLARQYSQRIKIGKPMVRQRSQDTDTPTSGDEQLSPVQEERPEKERRGKPNLTLPLASYDQVVLHALAVPAKVRSPSPADTTSSIGSPRVASPGPDQSSCRSPLSPAHSETFSWPDVRELRSMYAPRGSEESLAGRSQSGSEKVASGQTTCANCSSKSNIPQDVTPAPSHHHPGDPNEGQARLCRTGSLGPQCCPLHPSDFHVLRNLNLDSTGYYVSGQAQLTDNRRVIVMERVAEDTPRVAGTEPQRVEENDAQSGARPEDAEDSHGNYVQIRSPTTREKISILAVIDRCKAYQESEEYRQRLEGGVRAESSARLGRDREPEQAPSINEQANDDVESSAKKRDGGQTNMVKNLRERFLNFRSNS